MLNSEEAVTYTLLRANSYAKDNRLLPAGFDKASADGLCRDLRWMDVFRALTSRLWPFALFEHHGSGWQCRAGSRKNDAG